MGLGRFGGGAGVTRWLAEAGADVLVTDLLSRSELAAALAGLDDLVDDGRVRLALGGHRTEDFTACDLVVANPSVPHPWKNPFLLAAEDAGVPITTEIRLLLERVDRRRVIGVTGSAGKSTTAAMIHHILNRTARTAHLGGNIGGSLLAALPGIGADDWVIVELSSAMLHWLGAGIGAKGAPGISPHVAVLTNVAPNHVDWHGTIAHYEACKQSIFAFQSPGDHAVRGTDLAAQRRPIPLKLPGRHNQHNALLAITATLRAGGVLLPDAVAALGDFAGLPHRLELVTSGPGLTAYDDSKSTLPETTLLAVASFKRPSLVHLIVGGHDKKVDLSAIAALAGRIGGLYTIGETGPALAAAAEAGGGSATRCGTLDVAVDRALDRILDQGGDDAVLLLSPGCASWDQFDNYEQRGAAFTDAVRARLAAMCPSDRS